MTTRTFTHTPLERLRHHVSGAIARGESAPIVEVARPAKHTPGPWSIEAVKDYMRPHDTGIDSGIPESIANARLIAAAPDLLRTLKNAREWLDELAGLLQDGALDAAEDWAGANAVSVDSTLAEAIAQAEGTQ